MPAVEVLVGTGAIKDCIREAKRTPEIPRVIAQGQSQYGMQTFDQCLLKLYRDGIISYETAREAATNADDFDLKVRGIFSTGEQSFEQSGSSERAPALHLTGELLLQEIVTSPTRSAPSLDARTARLVAADLLVRRAWTTRDLAARLRRRGAPADVADEVVADLDGPRLPRRRRLRPPLGRDPRRARVRPRPPARGARGRAGRGAAHRARRSPRLGRWATTRASSSGPAPSPGARLPALQRADRARAAATPARPSAATRLRRARWWRASSARCVGVPVEE